MANWEKIKQYPKNLTPEALKKIKEAETDNRKNEYQIVSENDKRLTKTQLKNLTELQKTTRIGKKPKYNPEQLYILIEEYKKYIEQQIVQFEIPKTNQNGEIVKLTKKRPPTILGFCQFAEISYNLFNSYVSGRGDAKDTAPYRHVAYELIDYCNAYMLEGAITGDINSNIAKFGLINQASGFQDVSHITVESDMIKKPAWLSDVIEITDKGKAFDDAEIEDSKD